MGQPRPLFRLFLVFFKQTIQLFQQINVKKCQSSIWCWDLKPQPLEHELSPITTRPGLLPPTNTFFLEWSPPQTLRKIHKIIQGWKIVCRQKSLTISVDAFTFKPSDGCAYLHSTYLLPKLMCTASSLCWQCKLWSKAGNFMVKDIFLCAGALL